MLRPLVRAVVPVRVRLLILERLRRWWRSTQIAPFHARYRQTPCPLTRCLDFRKRSARVMRCDNPLSPKPLILKGSALKDVELAARLAGEDFGGWSPQIDSMNWLIAYLADAQPRRMLEFGSGRTTLCWVVVLSRLFGPDGFRLLSIDQDAENVVRARKRLDGLPGAQSVRIVHAPLNPAQVDGLGTFVYNLDTMKEHLAWVGAAEFVFVDGPWAEGPCRHSTLPNVRAHVQKGARFVLDDALRDKELLTGSLWARDGFQVDGILTIGQGIMLGRV